MGLILPREERESDMRARIIAKHGDTFSLDRFEFIDWNTPVILTCKHGDNTYYVGNVLRSDNSGCYFCVGERRRLKQASKVVDRFREVHGQRYGYSKFTYEDMHTKGTITCLKHGDFEMTPANHLSDHGCSSCLSNASSKAEIAWIDAIEIELGRRGIRGYRPDNRIREVYFIVGSVAVEYDGAYWHAANHERDEWKTSELAKLGYTVVRLRAQSKRHKLKDIPGAINIPVSERKIDRTTLNLVTKTIKENLNE